MAKRTANANNADKAAVVPAASPSAPWLEHLLTARLSLLLTQAMRYPADGKVTQTVVPTDRLIWIQKGTLTYQTENITTHLSAGDFWLVPAWTRRAWQVKSKAGCSMAWVEFIIHGDANASAKAPADPATHPTPIVQLAKAPDAIKQAMNHFLLLAQNTGTHQPLLAEMQLKWLLAQIVHQGSDPRPTIAQPPAAAAVDHGLSDLITYIHQHLHEPNLLTDLPKRASLSPGRLRMRFAKATGQSPGRYIQSLRMQRARYWLLTTDMSVKEIAAKTGFDDPLYFSRRYRTYWGRPATQDRAPSP